MDTDKTVRGKHITKNKGFSITKAVIIILAIGVLLLCGFLIFRTVKSNNDPALPMPSEIISPTPHTVSTETPVAKSPDTVQENTIDRALLLSMQNISAGASHSVALKTDGTVVAVGENTSGQCDVAAWRDIVAVEAGYDCTFAIMQDGYVVAAGNNTFGQFTEEWEYLKAVSANMYHIVGLRDDGTVVSLGNNDSGQCDTSAWADIIAISTGRWHTVGLKSDGTVVAVGSNSEGQCNVDSWTNIVAIAAGGAHTVGLTADGRVLACGYNEYKQTDVQEWSDIIAIDAALVHTVGLKADGTVVATGYNTASQCNVESWTDIVAIAAGDAHTLGLKSDGTMLSIGSNAHQQSEVSAWTDIKQGVSQPDFSSSATTTQATTGSENISWDFDYNSGTLTISGSGPMTDFTAESAFDAPWSNLSNVSSIVIEEGITAVGNWEFLSLVRITPGQGIKTITFPSSLNHIGEASFELFFDLTDIYYNGTKAQWDMITVEDGNDFVYSANIHFTDSDSQTATAAEFSCSFDESTATLTIIGHGEMPKYENETPWIDYRKDTKVLIIEEGISSISESAFSAFANIFGVEGGLKADEGMTTVVLPSTLTRIDIGAFTLCPFIDDVYYAGTQEQWQNILIKASNGDLTSAAMHFGEPYTQ